MYNSNYINYKRVIKFFILVAMVLRYAYIVVTLPIIITKALLIFSLVFLCGIFSLSDYRNVFDKYVMIILPISLTIPASMNISTIYDNSYLLCIYYIIDIIIFYLFCRVDFDLFCKDDFWPLLFCGISIFSCAYSSYISISLFGMHRIFNCVILYLFFKHKCNNSSIEREFIKGLKIAMIFQCTIAILQYFNGGTIGLSFLGEVESAMRTRVVDGALISSVSGTFLHSSRLAIFLFFCYWFIYYCVSNNIKNKCYVSIIIIVLWFTGSRTVLGLLVLSHILELALNHKYWFNTNLGFQKFSCIFFVSCILFLLGIMYNKFDFIINSDLSFQFMNRLNHWQFALDFVDENFFLGKGYNSYLSFFGDLSGLMETWDENYFYYVNPVHNVYILMIFEIGVIGFVLYVSMFICSLKRFLDFDRLSNIRKSALMFIFFAFIYNIQGWALSDRPCIYLLFIAIGILANNVTFDNNKNTEESLKSYEYRM